MRRDFREVVFSDEAHDLDEAIGQIFGIEQLALGIGEGFIDEGLTHVHTLNPAKHIRRTHLHQLQGSRVAGQMGIHGSYKPVIGYGGMAAKDERIGAQMPVHQSQELGIAFLDQALRIGIDAEHHSSLPHAAACMEESSILCIRRQVRWEDISESLTQEWQVYFVEVPAVVHRGTQQSVRSKQFEQVRDQEQFRGIGIDRVLAEAGSIEMVDYVRAVLND